MYVKRVGIICGRPIHQMGGVERSVVSMIEALNQHGYEVQLASLYKPDLKEVKRVFGKEIRLEKIYAPKVHFPYGETISRILLIPILLKMMKNVDFIIHIDGGFLHNIIPSDYQNYMIYLLSHTPNPSYSALMEKNVLKKGIIIFSTKLFEPSKKHPIIVHNKFTAKELLESYNVKAIDVLYPPISKDFYNYEAAAKENKIVHVARFSPLKKHEFALYVLDLVLRKRKDVMLYLIGSSSQRLSDAYISFLKKVIEIQQLGDNVKILVNADHKTVTRILKESKIFLSFQTIPESFNMTIIEAMAAGCIPIVPRCNRGAWDEILVEGKYGYGFNKFTECAEIIFQLLALNEDEFRNLSLKAVNRAKYFSEDEFKRRFLRLLSMFKESKG
jgi:glycosyltransferase involved in cell wall biosynthesis